MKLYHFSSCGGFGGILLFASYGGFGGIGLFQTVSGAVNYNVKTNRGSRYMALMVEIGRYFQHQKLF